MDGYKIPRDRQMSNEEVRRGLRLLIAGEGAQQHGQISQLARLCGVDRQMLYHIRDGNYPISDQVRAQLTEYLPRLERGEIRFHRRSSATSNQFRRRQVEVTWEVEYLEPPPVLPPPQPRIVPVGDWQRWARCLSCGGRRYSEFQGLSGRCMACDGCVSAVDRQMLEAPRP
jgi:hypothetical protein